MSGRLAQACGLRWLERRQAGDGARVLARAFADDPLNVEFVPDQERRQKVLRSIFEFLLRHGCAAGQVCVSDGGIEGVAVWFESERLGMSWWSALRCGGLKVIFGVERRVLARYQEFGRLAREVQARVAPEPHLYLAMLGVDPEHQGRGLGRRLVEAMLEQADREGRRSYLETEVERNIGFYRRFGFEVAEELALPRTAVVVRAMVRGPESPGRGRGG